MCSNTSSSGGGCGSGGNSGSGSNGNGNLWSHGIKKKAQQKRPKVPKRGPGVAELEKILREQEKDKFKGFSSVSLVSHNSNPYINQPLKSHPSQPYLPPPPPGPPLSLVTMTSNPMTRSSITSNILPIHVPLAPKFDHFNPGITTRTNIQGNGGQNNKTSGRTGAGSGLVLPEEAFFPMALNSSKLNIDLTDGRQSDSGNLLPTSLSNESNRLLSSPLLQKRNFQYPPAMINQLIGSAALYSSSSSSARMYSTIEPPSNQNASYNFTSMPTEDQKMAAGVKRPYPFSLDNSPIPPPDFEVPPTFSDINRTDQSFTNDNHSTYGFGSANAISRDTKWGNPLEINSRRYISDHGLVSDHGNFLTISTPSVPPPPAKSFQVELPKYNMLPFQDSLQDSYKKPETGGSNHRPFYTFLQVKGQVKETSLGSNSEGGEVGDDGIDLNLKL